MVITTSDIYFKDEFGRTLLLRGANVGGTSKLPVTPDGATHLRDGFYEHRTVSFVGRPFPLADADSHFRRLASWGMTFLRFTVTWEAIEHAGPGIYDQAYLDYLRAVLIKAGEHGLHVFIDLHQDVWSRWTGGDGAPGWTFDLLGMDVSKLYASGAAFTHQEHGDPFPRMIWSTNYARYGAATLFTLFFAGRDFAPNTLIDGVNVQDYLQTHYFNALRQVLERLADLPHVIGCDAMNEPSPGLIGVRDLGAHPERDMLMLGPMPTPFQGISAASGHPQTVDVFDLGLGFSNAGGTQVLNPDGVSLFLPGRECPWKREGVWTDDGGQPVLLRPDHFAAVGGRPVDFLRDTLKPFIRRFTVAMRDVAPNALIFIEGIPGGAHPDWSEDDAPGAVNAAHWYDGVTLFTKMYNPELAVDFFRHTLVTGAEAVRQAYIDQLAHTRAEADARMGGIPTLVGEFGVPFDLFEGSAYVTGDYSAQIQALDNYYDALDANLLSATIWNYAADNVNAHGDLWNGEDLSIFSLSQQTQPNDPNSGGRALAGCVRPYARATAGEPLRMTFELATRTFEYEYVPDAGIAQPTEIYLPALHYPGALALTVEGGSAHHDPAGQRLLVHAAPGAERVRVSVAPA